ncbi:MAG: hypothetical protein UT63_C0076G0007 [Candidatus Gottesmanbacteria bacterium GW2011_GWC2_39_8]|uniref:Uncharacterized protein n=1 Tax=Candidatus Gottesmanbacteria bacterium GW2011_GWC2_39_8 TaxID=1618450 RepID=A0A0G0Q1Q9_9BACT|nr:MAG: hypothetical protein UT63_C0076G0007 [Candidatus Gottesmanbacteria bacterium GW2011_GWC2_39_8]
MIAVPNDSITNPLTKREASSRIIALIIKVKRPRVKMLMGRVKMIKIGLISVLRTAITMTTRKAVT